MRLAAGVKRWSQGRRLLTLLFVATLPLVTPRLRASDEIEYFAYLRSLVFDRDLSFGNEYQHFYEQDPGSLGLFKKTFLDMREPATGRHINFGPIGSAVLWAPLYLLAHLGVTLLGGVADGYSPPYIAAVAYGSALFSFGGFLLVHDMLRRQGAFAEPAASWSPAALWLATPVLYYSTLAPGFSHAASLLAVSLLLWVWLRARDREGPGAVWAWALVGAAGGLCALVREQDGLFLAAPALDLGLATVRRREWTRGLVRGAAMAGVAFLVFLPQLAVYKVLTGAVAPSKMVSGKMDYSSPHFLEVLFDPGHGLFLWSPILLVAVVGMGVAIRRGPLLVTSLLALAFLLQVWVCGALSTWQQAGAFGARRFVAATPVFAWGLAAVVGLAIPRLGKLVAAATLAVFAWWNVSLMVQFGLRLMDRQRLEWPRVARNQVVEVPPRLLRAAVLFFSDRERLVKEGLEGR
jgi:hypothetical protein